MSVARYDASFDDRQSFDVSVADHERFQSKMSEDQSLGKLEAAETFVCAPYKSQLIQMELDNALLNNTDHNNIIAKLCEMGIKVYLIMYDSEDLKDDLIKIVEDASNDDRTTSDYNRVCLFKDEQGRVFNLVLSGTSTGLSSQLARSLAGFSGLQATCAMTILARSLGCIPQAANESVGLTGGYLALIIGLVLSEEISHSVMHAAMCVNGMPSTSAYALMSHFNADVPKNLLLILLAASNFVGGGQAQSSMILAGVGLACLALAANLGARAWQNLSFSSIKYTGPGSYFLSYMLSAAVGIFAPFMGFREMEIGGQAALESLIVSALVVGVVFIASDVDVLQSFIVVGSEACNQDLVNVVIGGWFFLSVIASILLSPFIKCNTRDLEEEEFLEESENSPVGYLCRNLPSFYVDPVLISKPTLCCNEIVVKVIGGVLAAIVGGAIISIGLFKDEIQQISNIAW